MSTTARFIKKQAPFIHIAMVLVSLFLPVYMTTHSAVAACTSDAECGSRACRLPDGVCVARLESGIPGVGPGGAGGQGVPNVPTYINYLYVFVLGFVGIAGFISLVIWGTVWVGSAVVDQKARALEGIKNTLIGIGIALTAFIMLYTINPDLTVIKTPETAIIDTTNKAKALLEKGGGPIVIVSIPPADSQGCCIYNRYVSATGAPTNLYKSCDNSLTKLECTDKKGLFSAGPGYACQQTLSSTINPVPVALCSFTK